MIISTEKKLMMFFVPRTGTNTIRTMFESTNIPLTLCDDSHNGYGDVIEITQADPKYAIEFGFMDYRDFRFFAFYRDPFDRCLSVLNYLRRGKQHSKFFHVFYGDSYPISSASRRPYAEWTDEMRKMCDSVPMIEVFRKFKWFMERGVYGKTHRRWLEGPIELLNYADYDNEVARVLTEFGVNPTTVTIPHINPSLTIPEFDSLSTAEENEIRDYLKEDYDFLASKGITFS